MFVMKTTTFTPSRLFLPLLVLALTGSFLLPNTSRAQVAIYTLQFESLSPSVNYRGFESGFAVLDLSGGPADFILVFEDETGRNFVRSEAFGTYFVASEDGEQIGVLANPDTGTTPVNTFAAIGKVDTPLSATVTTTDDESGVVSLANVDSRLPKKLEGIILTVDDSTAGFFDANAGTAGSSQLTAKLDLVRTNRANRQEKSRQDVLDDLSAELRRTRVRELLPTGDTPATEPDGAVTG